MIAQCAARCSGSVSNQAGAPRPHAANDVCTIKAAVCARLLGRDAARHATRRALATRHTRRRKGTKTWRRMAVPTRQHGHTAPRGTTRRYRRPRWVVTKTKNTDDLIKTDGY
eukprot:gene10783-biopygen2272